MLEFIHGYYTHKRTKVKYRTLKGRDSDGLVMSKDNINRVWNLSVIYTDEENKNVYCRELKDFEEKFELKQEYINLCYGEKFEEK